MKFIRKHWIALTVVGYVVWRAYYWSQLPQRMANGAANGIAGAFDWLFGNSDS